MYYIIMEYGVFEVESSINSNMIDILRSAMKKDMDTL
ncbi:hypothetical protein H4V97_003173 [Flavobacterium sp. CG_23.5]|nr:hypothetical protein [Flavobacterium sp. CG_23.5]